ncbi:VWA domain-containing protein [uncultured Vibrio sp.]|uniref:VWA domain-containing protein n=1 Tax=uncultured Vibrio sp. TaxID=114054 RepID=UPI0026006202|nr:VWA domain-containing protein [uncultured Vibrio sp.]
MMTGFLDALEAFHLLRPMWALSLPMIGLVWWVVRKRSQRPDKKPTGIAPHLSEAMTLKQANTGRWRPIDTTALAIAILAFSACGPTWTRANYPFQSESAPMVVVMEVTRSMEAPDLPPSRLDRARFKVIELIERRAGAQTAAIVYSGSSHRLAPMTEDPLILRTMFDALSPDIMPKEGNALQSALDLAEMELSGSNTPGTILVVTDGIEGSDLTALNDRDDKSPVIVLFAAPASEPLGLLDQFNGPKVVRIGADDTDITEVQQLANSAYESAMLGNEELEWEDQGWVFAWIAALLIAFWFRKGWTVQWSLVLCSLTLGTLHSNPVQAETVDYFLTKDQQAAIAYDNQDYETASQTYENPMWRAQALMQMGDFEAAADIYMRIDIPEAAFAEGYCWQQAQYFRQSIRAYERALVLKPDYPEAKYNLMLARAIAQMVTSDRKRDGDSEQSGGGKGNAEDGYDEIRKDIEKYSSTSSPTFATTEEWMRAVDTDMSEFLKARFKMEAQEEKQ